MRELFRFIEEPRPCSYLPDVSASLEVRLIANMSPEEYGDLMERGYRRFGMQIFRPACAPCEECRSMRIPVRDFKLSRSHKRILRQNSHIRAELHDVFSTTEHADLFNRYHLFMEGHRGWNPQQTNPQDYYRDFVTGGAGCARQWLYFDDTRLVGVALMDEIPRGISLVYFFYDPAWRPLSPGTFSILNQLLYARQAGLDYAYFGYWVAGCQSLKYKSRFVPHQILQGLPEDGESAIWL